MGGAFSGFGLFLAFRRRRGGSNYLVGRHVTHLRRGGSGLVGAVLSGGGSLLGGGSSSFSGGLGGGLQGVWVGRTKGRKWGARGAGKSGQAQNRVGSLE